MSSNYKGGIVLSGKVMEETPRSLMGGLNRRTYKTCSARPLGNGEKAVYINLKKQIAHKNKRFG